MKKIHVTLLALGFLIALAGCARESRYHKTSLPDPASFNAHFGDMDTNGDDYVDWPEFNAYFPQASTDIFAALDLNDDQQVDHDEWHEFKAAHGMKHHE